MRLYFHLLEFFTSIVAPNTLPFDNPHCWRIETNVLKWTNSNQRKYYTKKTQIKFIMIEYRKSPKIANTLLVHVIWFLNSFNTHWTVLVFFFLFHIGNYSREIQRDRNWCDKNLVSTFKSSFLNHLIATNLIFSLKMIWSNTCYQQFIFVFHLNFTECLTKNRFNKYHNDISAIKCITFIYLCCLISLQQWNRSNQEQTKKTCRLKTNEAALYNFGFYWKINRIRIFHFIWLFFCLFLFSGFVLFFGCWSVVSEIGG